MDTIDYLVTVQGVLERGRFYNEMHKRGYTDHMDTRDHMIHSSYPFGVCIKKKKIMVIESATQCYLMSRQEKVITIEMFYILNYCSL